MFDYKMTPGISISYRYSDEHMTQLEISASNGAYTGTCEPYFDRETLKEISRALNAFPTTPTDEYIFEFSEAQLISYLRFFVKDNRGRIGIECQLYGGRADYRDSANFFVFTEAAQVNQAGLDLEKLIEDEKTDVFIRHEN